MLENILIRMVAAIMVFSFIGFVKFLWNKFFGKPQSDDEEQSEEL